LNTEKRVLDRPLFYKSEEHGRNVSLPWDLIMLLEHLES
jgi:hypothetical protein